MIRLLNSFDAPEYRKLRCHSLNTDPKAFVSNSIFEQSLPENYHYLKLKHARQKPIFGFYGYFTDNQLVAYTQLAKDFYPHKAHLAYIYELYVHPNHRRQQIGSKLLIHLITKSKTYPSLETIIIRVNNSNLPAITLYKKNHFQIIATIKNTIKYSENYQDELTLTLKL